MVEGLQDHIGSVVHVAGKRLVRGRAPILPRQAGREGARGRTKPTNHFKNHRDSSIVPLMRATELTDEPLGQCLENRCYLPDGHEDLREPTTATPLTASYTCCAPAAAGRTYPESTAPPLPVGGGLERARKMVFVGAFSHARDSAYYFSRIGGGEYSTPDGDRQGVP